MRQYLKSKYRKRKNEKEKLFKASLRVRIILSLLVLLAFQLVEISGVNYLMQEYSSGIQNMNRNLVELNQEKFSDIFSGINKEVAYLLVNETDFMKLPMWMNEEVSYEKSMKLLELSQSIQNRLSNLANMYGSKYYFWYYDTKSKTYIDSYYENQNKIKYKKSIIDKIENNPEQISDSKRFCVSDDKYIELINNRSSVYVGASISVDDFYRMITKSSLENECEYSIYDEEGSLIEARVYSKGKEIKNVKLGDSSFLQNEIVKMKSCDFQIGIAAANRIVRYAKIINYFLIISQIIFVTVAAGILLFAGKGILRPLQKFSRMLEEFPEKGDKIQPENIQELGEAGELLNRLVEQIRELERNIYEEKIKKQKIQLDYAQIKIRPHFFINCLNVIHSMAKVGREEEIQDLCLYVSSYLRSLYSCTDSTYALQEEMEVIRNYLNIAKEVNGQVFYLKEDIEKATEQIQIPPLLIETFVENSLKYAKSIRSIEITIRTHLEKEETGTEKLMIQIEDTGKGFAEEILKSLNAGSFERKDERHQIGIINIRERLSLMYGEKGTIRFYNTEFGAGVQISIEGIQKTRETDTEAEERHEK